MVNEKVIAGLNPASKVTDIYAYLADESGKLLTSFLFNPEEKSFSRQAKYDEGATALTSTPSQFYRYTTGNTLRLNNLLLESYSRGKTCKLLLERLEELMVADPLNSKYAPSVVYFKWGKDSFGPAVITDLSWSETSWLNGEVATARVSFSLLEIPINQSSNKSVASGDRLKDSLNKSKVLTARQKEDAISKAKIWLNQNIKRLPEDIASIIRVKSFSLSTSDNGFVTLLNNKGKALGQVGIYKDGKLDTYLNTLIP